MDKVFKVEMNGMETVDKFPTMLNATIAAMVNNMNLLIYTLGDEQFLDLLEDLVPQMLNKDAQEEFREAAMANVRVIRRTDED